MPFRSSLFCSSGETRVDPALQPVRMRARYLNRPGGLSANSPSLFPMEHPSEQPQQIHPQSQILRTDLSQKILELLDKVENGQTEKNKAPQLLSDIMDAMRFKKGVKTQCPKCCYKDDNKSSFKDHINLKHIGSKAYPCKICYQPFKTTKKCNDHMKKIHPETNLKGKELPATPLQLSDTVVESPVKMSDAFLVESLVSPSAVPDVVRTELFEKILQALYDS